MMNHLIAYVKAEANCSEERAEEIAYSIVDFVDEIIHNNLDEEDDYED